MAPNGKKLSRSLEGAVAAQSRPTARRTHDVLQRASPSADEALGL